jgi:hypothetical protein
VVLFFQSLGVCNFVLYGQARPRVRSSMVKKEGWARYDGA